MILFSLPLVLSSAGLFDFNYHSDVRLRQTRVMETNYVTVMVVSKNSLRPLFHRLVA